MLELPDFVDDDDEAAAASSDFPGSFVVVGAYDSFMNGG
jgi:hypothetical protein